MPGKVLRIVRLTRFTVLLREREINERNETRRDERKREREREGTGIDQREKEGKERGASARPFGIPGPRRERRRTGDV